VRGFVIFLGLLLMLGGAVAGAQDAPIDLSTIDVLNQAFDKVPGSRDFLKTPMALYAGGGAAGFGLLLIIIAAATGGKKKRRGHSRREAPAMAPRAPRRSSRKPVAPIIHPRRARPRVGGSTHGCGSEPRQSSRPRRPCAGRRSAHTPPKPAPAPPPVQPAPVPRSLSYRGGACNRGGRAHLRQSPQRRSNPRAELRSRLRPRAAPVAEAVRSLKPLLNRLLRSRAHLRLTRAC